MDKRMVDRISIDVNAIAERLNINIADHQVNDIINHIQRFYDTTRHISEFIIEDVIKLICCN